MVIAGYSSTSQTSTSPVIKSQSTQVQEMNQVNNATGAKPSTKTNNIQMQTKILQNILKKSTVYKKSQQVELYQQKSNIGQDNKSYPICQGIKEKNVVQSQIHSTLKEPFFLADGLIKKSDSHKEEDQSTNYSHFSRGKHCKHASSSSFFQLLSRIQEGVEQNFLSKKSVIQQDSSSCTSKSTGQLLNNKETLKFGIKSERAVHQKDNYIDKQSKGEDRQPKQIEQLANPLANTNRISTKKPEQSARKLMQIVLNNPQDSSTGFCVPKNQFQFHYQEPLSYYLQAQQEDHYILNPERVASYKQNISSKPTESTIPTRKRSNGLAAFNQYIGSLQNNS